MEGAYCLESGFGIACRGWDASHNNAIVQDRKGKNGREKGRLLEGKIIVECMDQHLTIEFIYKGTTAYKMET